jgi:2'-5' RNA ligase
MSETLRLFIAIELPENVILALKKLSGDFPFLRILPVSKAHLTLKFLGDIAKDRLPELRRVLEDVRGHSFELKFSGLGTFRSGRGQIFWAGMADNPVLTELFTDINTKLRERMGIEVEKKRFFPHITLARSKNHGIEIMIKAKNYQGELAPPFKVSSFGLYQSELTPLGAVHTLLSEYSLS